MAALAMYGDSITVDCAIYLKNVTRLVYTSILQRPDI